MTVMEYRTRDGLADYGFSLEFQSNIGWRVYIIFQPLHLRHGDSLPYQVIDANGRSYVNWSAKLDNLGEAKLVAGLWAELIHHDQRRPEQRSGNDQRTRDPSAVGQRRTDAA